jgi:hypothetical protein
VNLAYYYDDRAHIGLEQDNSGKSRSRTTLDAENSHYGCVSNRCVLITVTADQKPLNRSRRPGVSGAIKRSHFGRFACASSDQKGAQKQDTGAACEMRSGRQLRQGSESESLQGNTLPRRQQEQQK